MTFQEFQTSLGIDTPPSCSPLLTALWWDGKGDWEKAHEIAQDIEDSDGAWVHAYLHRKEGDLWNADYWYARAGKSRPDITLKEEWQNISEDLLKR